MKVKLKSADAINLHLKSQTLFLNMQETNSSLEWNSKLSGTHEIKPEPKGFASYNALRYERWLEITQSFWIDVLLQALIFDVNAKTMIF